MTTYNTGNPIGSTDARDRLDNTENMDILENSTTKLTHPDRLGTVRKTRRGMEVQHDNQISVHEVEHDNQIAAHEVEHDNQIAAHEAEHDNQIAAHEAEHDNQIAAHEAEHDAQMQSFENDFDGRLAGMAFTRVGSFAAGATLTDMRQVLIWEVSQGGDGHEYGWTGTFPKVVAAGATPANSGGIGAGAWVDRTDITLRAELLSNNVWHDGLATKSHAKNGWQKLPNGLVFQWGYASYDDVSINLGIPIVFPIAFPEASPYSFIATLDTVQYAAALTIHALTHTGINVVVHEYDGSFVAGTIRWFAVGR